MIRRAGGAWGLPLLIAAGRCAPAITSLPQLRRATLPGLSGLGGNLDVALTFDDGPDPVSTPAFLDLLARHHVRATFFLLGAWVAPHRGLVREMADAGHELAIHGWDHRCLAWKRPFVISDELQRARDLVEDVAGVEVERYRPPYGVMTTDGLTAARRVGMRTVLWTAWGRDWSPRATPASVVRKVDAGLRRGGTVLLHDTDRTSAAGSWHVTLAASQRLLEEWQGRGWSIGSLREHADPRPGAYRPGSQRPMLAG